MGLYGYEEFFKLLKGYILLACSALKVDSGYHSKRLEPFLQIMACLYNPHSFMF